MTSLRRRDRFRCLRRRVHRGEERGNGAPIDMTIPMPTVVVTGEIEMEGDMPEIRKETIDGMTAL